MGHTIFLAGASGAIGQRLVPLLADAGHRVYGTTRHAAKAPRLAALGATPVIVDVLDAAALADSVTAVRPHVVIHQLTDLPGGLDPTRMADAVGRNAHLRDVGTRNLVAAAAAARARRLIAQSIAWAYAPGRTPYVEDDPLDLAAEGARGISVAGVVALEQATLREPTMEGLVLRYGHLYGPGTGAPAATGNSPVHVDAAAWAALLAVERGAPGAYNVTEDNRTVANDKAKRELGWDPGFRIASDAAS